MMHSLTVITPLVSFYPCGLWGGRPKSQTLAKKIKNKTKDSSEYIIRDGSNNSSNVPPLEEGSELSSVISEESVSTENTFDSNPLPISYSLSMPIVNWDMQHGIPGIIREWENTTYGTVWIVSQRIYRVITSIDLGDLAGMRTWLDGIGSHFKGGNYVFDEDLKIINPIDLYVFFFFFLFFCLFVCVLCV